MKRQYGDFGDAGLDDPVPGVPLAKSNDDLTSGDLERMCHAFEILERRIPRLSKASLFRIQYRLGLEHRRLQKAIIDYVTRPRKETMNKMTRGNMMDDAGLDDDKKPVIPQVGTKDTFVKTRELDAFGEELKK